MDDLTMSPLTGPSRASRARRAGAWGVAPLLISLLVAATGCSASTGTPGAYGAADATLRKDPGSVALHYSTALFSGRFGTASSFVLPRERGVLKVLFTGMTSSSVRSRKLAIGSVHTKGATGTIVLTGEICSSGVIPKGATIAPHHNEKCVENHQPDSKNPAFRVAVCRDSEKWYVCFPKFDAVIGRGTSSATTQQAVPSPSSGR
ncbi:hypothetical protein [Streptomyces sp. NPDC004682]